MKPAKSARVIFRVGQVANGDYVIELEPMDGDLAVPGKASLAFKLADGTSVNKAEEIAAFLQENVAGIFYESAP